jgi:hypothetical protein
VRLVLTKKGGSDTTICGGPMLMPTLTSARAGSENPHATAIIAPANRHHRTLLEFPIRNLLSFMSSGG